MAKSSASWIKFRSSLRVVAALKNVRPAYFLQAQAKYRLDVRLTRRPVAITIENGEAKNIDCEDRNLLDFILRNLDVPHGRRVGELGFGTNPGVVHPLRHNSHLNERKRGIHLGFGQHNQSAKSEYHCDVHLDFIADGGKIWIDGAFEPIDILKPPKVDIKHPSDVMDEDVLSPYSVEFEGDCCGTSVCIF